MTELEKFDTRLDAIDMAITYVKMAQGVDRKLTHDKHPGGQGGHFTKALEELISIKSGITGQRTRLAAIGR